MKKIRVVVMGVLLFVSFVCPGGFLFGQEAAVDADPHKTGLRELTADELKTIEKTHSRVKQVRLNALGLQRTNEHRSKKGLSLISEEAIVPDGQELITGVGAASGGIKEQSSLSSAMAVLPASADNSLLKYFPPIRSQGSLPSCASFSGVYYVMTYMFARAKDLDAKNGTDAERLSPKWTYNMVNDGALVGSWYYWAYDIGIKHGIATWLEFPYDSDYRGWCLKPEVWRASIYRRFNNYGYVANTNQDSGISLVKQMLLDGYILNIPTYISSWQYKTISNDPSTSADDAYAGKSICYWVNGTNGYHAMAVVGYNDDIWTDINNNGAVDAGEKGAFRIANSWGTGWGEAGFCWMAYDALKSPSAVTGGPSTGRIMGWSPAQAHWVTARSSYSPVLLGEFTVNHLKRNQLRMTLGISDTMQSAPSTTWYPNAIYYDGGAYAFNGGTAAIDGTFVFDFSDIAPAVSGMKRFYLGAYDLMALDPATIKDFRLVDLLNGTQAISADVPKTADASQAYSFIDYNFNNGNIAPAAVITVNATSGNAPLTVSFDGSASYDSDGSINSYTWDCGDGYVGNGVSLTHTYANAGNFTAVLTVTDNLAATASASADITVYPDPNTILAPSNLIAGVQNRTITLNWSDNSNNEEGFYIERSVKSKSFFGSFLRIADLGVNISRYGDTVLSSGTYKYRVQAYNRFTGKVSSYSNEAQARVK